MNTYPFLSLCYNDIFLTICQYVIIFAVHLTFQNSNNIYYVAAMHMKYILITFFSYKGHGKLECSTMCCTLNEYLISKLGKILTYLTCDGKFHQK